MTRIRLGPGVIEDLERIAAYLRDHESEHAGDRAEDIVSALDVLTGNPLIGRPAHGDSRELVIGRGSRGYLALYRYVDVTDTVVVLALRAQREAGYARGT
ncbi:type II toxin-antitoxin system RelE/ParE family toxin [Pseudoxanthomonas winnipegensis]|uniref:type II toxin-antitoxin system RelE/ParE family toxin n=1 Tax=Pseudoxanthomonas winnipegensis TaxID=2480810 RepID=UPI00102D9609|nr:type II toxin-antitoxin system RelE/ParE family toxin [Pseudoxanthomonas winnipegensis]TAA44052.1 type II toxin-antitoxin system RelE/ParE family toxin [Pseudoxanthomonas winnipegensis]